MIIRLISMSIFLLCSTGFNAYAAIEAQVADVQHADQSEKTLHFRSIHTGEALNITFWVNGAYIPEALQQLNYFFRDHRNGDVVTMDPELFSIIHRLYEEMDAEGVIEVISGHRSQATNDMLRSQGRKVAKKSQHVLGKAIDFRFPGVPLKKMRDTVLGYGLGGVGYYPNSNFIHVDTGRPRFW